MQGLLEERARLHLALHTIKEMTNMITHVDALAAEEDEGNSIKAARPAKGRAPEDEAVFRVRPLGVRVQQQRGEVAERPLPCQTHVRPGAARSFLGRWHGPGRYLAIPDGRGHCQVWMIPPRDAHPPGLPCITQAEAREFLYSHRRDESGHPALCPEGRARATLFYSLINPFETGWVAGVEEAVASGCVMKVHVPVCTLSLSIDSVPTPTSPLHKDRSTQGGATPRSELEPAMIRFRQGNGGAQPAASPSSSFQSLNSTHRHGTNLQPALHPSD